MLLRTVAALSATLALSGCSSVYEIRAVVIGGKVAFVPADTDIWGEPDCISSIKVSVVDGPPAAPASRGGETYWNKAFAVTSCDNHFPVQYGAALKGPPFREMEKYAVEAKPLRIGAVCEVATLSEGSAYGGGMFMTTDERKIVNLRY